MNLLKKIFKTTNWERVKKVPKWVKFPLTDKSNFVFYAKGKNYKYKIQVYNYKTMSQKEKIWRKKR